MSRQPHKPFFLWRHLNKLRWVTLSLVFAMLVLLPFLHVYQTYVAAHAYDLLSPSEQRLYDVMEALTAPFTDDPAEDLDALKGNTWSGTFWGLKAVGSAGRAGPDGGGAYALLAVSAHRAHSHRLHRGVRAVFLRLAVPGNLSL